MANEAYAGQCNLNARELRILRLTDDNPGITFSELLGEAKFERTLTSRLLSKMVKSGLIRRSIGKEDARQFNLRTTAKGHELCAKAALIAGELEEHLLSPLTLAEREVLFSCLKKLTDWMDSSKKQSFENPMRKAATGRNRGASGP
jgi:DNA-binding MarR family transcriptional regulator